MRKRLLIVFRKSRRLAECCGLYCVDNQMNKKEVLPAWVTPPFLLCKDNTFFSEIQILFFRSVERSVMKKVRNCYKLGWWNRIAAGRKLTPVLLFSAWCEKSFPHLRRKFLGFTTLILIKNVTFAIIIVPNSVWDIVFNSFRFRILGVKLEKAPRRNRA